MTISASERALVRDRASGRCEYCLVPEMVALVAHEVDHVVARKHGGTDDLGNLALCCTLCNKRKGTDLTTLDPETGEVTLLFSPRTHHWSDHFRLVEGRIDPLTGIGRATVFLLRLNLPERVVERLALVDAGLLVLGPRE
jgi:hypothetical protein